MKKISLGQKDVIHFVGIGGIGMSGLAQIMRNMGFRIQGSDQNKNKNTINCSKLGIKVFIGHSSTNIKVPFISVPLPTSADNHQYKNALFYSKKGYGTFLEEKDIKNKLFDLIVSTFSDKLMLNSILLNQRQYSDKDIFENLNRQIEKILNEKN